MKTAGIVAEYNPFHNGHQYHIEETRQKTGADYVIAVMSGDFVQRGAPAFMDKYERAFCALSGGCDLVLELPVVYSSSSAEFFATGAVLLLDKLGVCDFLSFGSEDGSLETLTGLSTILSDEPEDYQILLRNHLKSGLSFPAAREKALEEYCTSHGICQSFDNLSAFLKGSNNILALEYLKTLKKSCSSIKPATILRKNAPYHDKKLHDTISSASAIRQFTQDNEEIEKLAFTVPEETYRSIVKVREENRGFPDYHHLTPYLHGALLSQQTLDKYLDWDTELANRLKQIPWATLTFTEIADKLKTRNVTHSRIHRALLHLILGIEKETFHLQFNRNPVPYARILGFRKESSALIKEIRKKGSLSLITKPASIIQTLNTEDYWMWEKDLAASRLYQSIQYSSFNHRVPSAYERSPIILP